MKKKELILWFFTLFTGLTGFSQIQTFNTPVRFKNVSEHDLQDSTRVSVLDETGLLKWISKDSLGGVHNNLSGLQGGKTGQYYHINEAQHAWIASQMYTNHTASFTVSPTTGERGVSTAVTINYNISSNDDEITSASINQGIGSVLADVDTGAKSTSGGSRVESLTWQLAISYMRNGNPGSQNRNATYTANNPRWQGISSSISDITTESYTDLTGGNGFTKHTNNPSSMTINLNNNTGEYVWFISTQNVSQITASGFDTSIGDWGDGGVFFWKKQVSGFLLADGTTTVTMWVYRTRELQNTGGNVIPFVFNP